MPSMQNLCKKRKKKKKKRNAVAEALTERDDSEKKDERFSGPKKPRLTHRSGRGERKVGGESKRQPSSPERKEGSKGDLSRPEKGKKRAF